MERGLISPKNTALIIIDVQNDYCSPIGKMAKRGFTVSHLSKLTDKIIKFVDKARNIGIPIIFTRMIEDPRYMSQNAKKLLSTNSFALCSPNTVGFEYFKIKPRKTDFEIIKKSYDAFSSIKLEKILKRKKIENIIVAGVHAQVCVDTTIRSGFTHGYNIIVPRDLVSTIKERKKEEIAAVNVWKLVFAHLTNSNEILAKWGVI